MTTTQKIRIGIMGFGNLGKGVVEAIRATSDLELIHIYTKRDPSRLQAEHPGLPFKSAASAPDDRDQIDVLILCGGSANDLPIESPRYAQWFNTVDSYDNHSKIPEHFAALDPVAKAANTTSLLSVGWDPGLFSLQRLLMEAVLPAGKPHTFWGEGLSQGHSDAVRRIEGVRHAAQYTIPLPAAMDAVRNSQAADLSPEDKHERVCYVVADRSAERSAIETAIKTMPAYFAPYKTTVHFLDETQFLAEHSRMPHGGVVIHTATTANDHKQRMEFSVQLDSNPEFTAAVLVAYARAVHRMHAAGHRGAVTLFDIPPAYLSPDSAEDLRKRLL